MLLRLVDHFRDNPKRIDKLIAIKGLPEKWFFRESPEGKELKKPWEADIDANIPHDIRHLCEPTYVILRYPALSSQAKSVIEKKQILGLRIDYNTEPGRQMWDDIERYVEESLPRDQRIPVPVVCAKDERSGFETYMPRRTARGSLELIPAPIPSIDLTQFGPVESEVKVEDLIPAVEVSETASTTIHQATRIKCSECDFEHESPRGIRMHAMKRHPKKEKVAI